jgi:hypothetical protein
MIPPRLPVRAVVEIGDAEDATCVREMVDPDRSRLVLHEWKHEAQAVALALAGCVWTQPHL